MSKQLTDVNKIRQEITGYKEEIEWLGISLVPPNELEAREIETVIGLEQEYDAKRRLLALAHPGAGNEDKANLLRLSTSVHIPAQMGEVENGEKAYFHPTVTGVDIDSVGRCSRGWQRMH